MDAVYAGESLPLKSKITITIMIMIGSHRHQQYCHAPPRLSDLPYILNPATV